MIAVNDPAARVPVLLLTLEQSDGANLGAPGPLVHTLDTWSGCRPNL